jgi:hypothetical protein
MKQVTFTGTLKIEDGVGLVREVNSSGPNYVGTPSPEMDAAWEDIVFRKSSKSSIFSEVKLTIITALNLFVTEQELEGNLEGTSPDPETGLYVAMSVNLILYFSSI